MTRSQRGKNFKRFLGLDNMKNIYSLHKSSLDKIMEAKARLLRVEK
jgi:hypothetical protein